MGARKGGLVHGSTLVVLKEGYIGVEVEVLERLLVEARVVLSGVAHM